MSENHEELKSLQNEHINTLNHNLNGLYCVCMIRKSKVRVSYRLDIHHKFL